MEIEKNGKGSAIPCTGMQLIHGDIPKELINMHIFPMQRQALNNKLPFL